MINSFSLFSLKIHLYYEYKCILKQKFIIRVIFNRRLKIGKKNLKRYIYLLNNNLLLLYMYNKT